MKYEPIVLANATAATTAIIFVVCRILVGLFPDVSFIVAQSWFHGIELGKAGAWNLSVESFVLGIVSAVVAAWLVGYLFALVYNWFLKKK